MKIKTSRILQALLVGCLATLLISTHCGCGANAQKTTYRIAATTPVSVEAALRLYNVAAAQGKTTIEQNQKVKAAYLKYQSSFALLCDSGAVYAAAGPGDAPAAAALQQAVQNSSATINDFIALVTSFGVKL